MATRPLAIDPDTHWPLTSARHLISRAEVVQAILGEPSDVQRSPEQVLTRAAYYMRGLAIADWYWPKPLIGALLAMDRLAAMRAVVQGMENPLHECLGVHGAQLLKVLRHRLIAYHNAISVKAAPQLGSQAVTLTISLSPNQLSDEEFRHSSLFSALLAWAWVGRDHITARARLREVCMRLEAAVHEHDLNFPFPGFFTLVQEAFVQPCPVPQSGSTDVRHDLVSAG